MKKLTREELKNIKGGLMGPPGGGGGPSLCLFTSTVCAASEICAVVNDPSGPFPPVSSCAAYRTAYLNSICNFTAQQVSICLVS